MTTKTCMGHLAVATAIAVVLCAFPSFAPQASAGTGRKLLFQEQQPKSAALRNAIRTWEERVSRLEREIATMQSGPHDDNDLMLKETDYIQSAVELFGTLNEGPRPLSLGELKDVGIIKDLPKSPYGDGTVEPKGLGDSLSPGAIVYAPEISPKGDVCGYWLIPIGDTREKCDGDPLKPLPGGASVPDGALTVLECHLAGC